MKLPSPILALVLSCLCGGTPATAAKRPNVIFILTDDQGWNDAHFAGHPLVKTPHLDRFAAQSTWIRQFYVGGSVCSPSRAAFMTGLSPARHQIHGHFSTHAQNSARHMPDWMDPKHPNVASLLKGAGYATAHFGKWHLGHGDGAPEPAAYGFEVSKTVNANGPQLGDEAREPYFRAKSTALMVDEAIAFLRSHRDQPFYLNLWTLLPHAKLNPTPEQLAVYESLEPSAKAEGFGPWLTKYLEQAPDLKAQMQVFCASLTDLDQQLGRLFAALEELQLADNSIVFFSSDNGAEDYRISNAANGGVGNTGPLRGRKRSLYEGGIRTLGLVRWPGHIAAGRRDDQSLMGGVDFLPTICKLTGVDLPAGLKLDGEDVSDIWLGQSRPRKAPLFWEWLFSVAGGIDGGYQSPALAVRDGPWKAFVNHDGSGGELYHIAEDIGESRNLAAEQPERLQQLSQLALAWAKTLPPSAERDKLLKQGQPGARNPPAQPAKATMPKAKGKAKAMDPAQRALIFKRWDSDGNGELSLEEYRAGIQDKADAPQRLKSFDANGNGRLSAEEFIHRGAAPRKTGPQP